MSMDRVGPSTTIAKPEGVAEAERSEVSPDAPKVSQSGGPQAQQNTSSSASKATPGGSKGEPTTGAKPTFAKLNAGRLTGFGLVFKPLGGGPSSGPAIPLIGGQAAALTSAPEHTSVRLAAKITLAVPQKHGKEITMHELPKAFATDAQAEAVSSHFAMKDGHLHMDKEAAVALARLIDNCPTSAKRVIEELKAFRNSDGEVQGPHLKAFIRYEVYKEITGHVQNMEATKQNMLLADKILTKYGFPKPTQPDEPKKPAENASSAELKKHAEDMRLFEVGMKHCLEMLPAYKDAQQALAKSLSAHVMCRCVYTDPMPSLVRKADLWSADGKPTEAGERLRAKPTGSDIQVIETASGPRLMCPHGMTDDQLSAALTEASTKPDKAQAGASELLAALVIDGKLPDNVQVIRYNPALQTLATVQVPVMSDAVTIEANLPPGLPLVRPGTSTPLTDDHGKYTFTLGTGPGEMFKIPGSPEDAGVYRRSPNSQRVIEVQAPQMGAPSAVLQIKGAGVPAYGFDHTQLTGLSGADYFDPSGDLQLAEFHQFARELGIRSDITHVGNACATGARVGPASTSDAGGRHGGISFRLDAAAGLRTPDIVTSPMERSKLERDSGADMVAFAKQTGVVSSDAHARDPVAVCLENAIVNYAVANLLGMVYEDSNLMNLTDLGARGSFPDAGTITDADPAQQGSLFFSAVDKVRDHLDQPPAALHQAAVVGLLKQLAGAETTATERAIGTAATRLAAIADTAVAQETISRLACALTTDDEVVNRAQEAFRSGMGAYKEYLAATIGGIGALR